MEWINASAGQKRVTELKEKSPKKQRMISIKKKNAQTDPVYTKVKEEKWKQLFYL